MSHDVYLMGNNKIIFVAVDGDLSIDEWGNLSEKVLLFVEAQHNDVYIIVDMLNMGSYPKNVMQIQKKTVWSGHERIASVIHITKDRLVEFLGNTVIYAALGKDYQQVRTLEEGFLIVKKMDEKVEETIGELIGKAESFYQHIFNSIHQ